MSDRAIVLAHELAEQLCGNSEEMINVLLARFIDLEQQATADALRAPRGLLCKVTKEIRSWHDFHHGCDIVQCDSLCELLPELEAALQSPEPPKCVNCGHDAHIAACLYGMGHGAYCNCSHRPSLNAEPGAAQPDYYAPNVDHIPDGLVDRRKLYRQIERIAGMTVAQYGNDCVTGDTIRLPDSKPAEIYVHILKAIAESENENMETHDAEQRGLALRQAAQFTPAQVSEIFHDFASYKDSELKVFWWAITKKLNDHILALDPSAIAAQDKWKRQIQDDANMDAIKQAIGTANLLARGHYEDGEFIVECVVADALSVAELSAPASEAPAEGKDE